MPRLKVARRADSERRRPSASTSRLAGRDLTRVLDLNAAEVRYLFDLASDIKRRPQAYARRLAGRSLALLFEKPSLRTRVTFDLGMQQLGGLTVYLGPQEIGLGKRELVADVARNLERWFSAIMVRTFGHDIVLGLAAHARIPVINGLSDLHHPCQALGDYLTLREHKRRLAGLRVTWVGDGNNVCHSLMEGAARLGITFIAATPRGFEPKAAIVEEARREAAATSAHILLVEDPEEAVRGADAVYTDVWASMGQEGEAEARRPLFLPYQVNRRLFSAAKPDALFMHCLPAHRGEEVTDEVIDSPRSVVYDQAENRLHIQKAILVVLVGRVR
jgi:ornithine carbamoyltransferase